jgi:zinc/manganese transport system substrate-binding protein
VALLSACDAGEPHRTDGRLSVVVAENFWGSIAAQLGGDRVAVTSLIHTPGADPHDYEPTPSDARAVASANYAIYNGLNYDPWFPRLLNASPAKGRVTLNIQDVLGLPGSDNPHRWYSPPDVHTVVDRITADYNQLDPAGSAYFDAQRTHFLKVALKPYDDLVTSIREGFAGTRVGATESIAEPLASALGLDLVTPAAFMRATSEGTDPSARDKATFDRQIASGEIAVLLYNPQNATPDVQRLVDAARARNIPVVSISETPDPATLSFQDWQTTQLQALSAALTKAVQR